MSQVLEVLAKDPKVLAQKKALTPKVPVIDIKSSLVHFLERLEQEYFKHLQDTDQQKITVILFLFLKLVSFCSNFFFSFISIQVLHQKNARCHFFS